MRHFSKTNVRFYFIWLLSGPMLYGYALPLLLFFRSLVKSGLGFLFPYAQQLHHYKLPISELSLLKQDALFTYLKVQ